MPKVIGFYTSSYSEPRKNLKSLGGVPSALLNLKGDSGNVFNDVEEYESSTLIDDYRIIYIGNISKSVAIIESSILNISIDFDHQIDKSIHLYLSNIHINIFIPPYGQLNSEHPIIYSNGFFRDGTASLGAIIRDEKTQTNYGKSVLLTERIFPGDYFPIVLHRRVRSPVTYLKNFTFNIDANYAVGT